MVVLSIREIFVAARAAGFSPDQSATWTAIALAESRGQTGALNSKGEHSVGLWQINIDPKVRGNHWGNLHDPTINARAAFEISGRGRDMRPWTTTHDHNKGTAADYRTYLDDVEASVGVKGDWRGVSGYGAGLPTPLPPQTGGSSYDQISQGAPLTSDRDTDSDGLTDDYEVASSRSNPRLADSDKDGLVDGHEVATSRSNPNSADTDGDTLSDPMEVSAGTNPAMLDSDHDGATDPGEIRFDADPLKADAGDGTAIPSAQRPSAQGLSATSPGGNVATAAPPLTAAQPLTSAYSMTAGQPMTAASSTSSLVDRFVEVALKQKGDRYIYGAQTRPSDPDPEAFDCSELTKWAAQQVGVKIAETAETQYLDLKSHNSLIPVDQGLKVKGALLFYFSSEPTGTGHRPAQAHVAISLGDGRTIEARGSKYGVNEFAAGRRFTYAGIIPGVSGTTATAPKYDQIDAGRPLDSAVDRDLDGLTDRLERLAGTSITRVDTDGDGIPDGAEALRSHTDPLSHDTDKDGMSDGSEVSAGTDPGRLAGVAGVAGHGLFAQNIRGGVKDADKDGLPDVYEKRTHLNPLKDDTDGDRISDGMEVSVGTDGTSQDTDRDGQADWLEIQSGSDPLTSGSALGGGVGQAGVPAAGEAAGDPGASLEAPPD